MKQKMNYEGMSYSELVAQKMALEMAINKMREQEMKRAFDELLKTYSVTKEELIVHCHPILNSDCHRKLNS